MSLKNMKLYTERNIFLVWFVSTSIDRLVLGYMAKSD